ncbi:hypothetical protein HRI_002640400 [Hibiscus trionum]|uniref:EF-hand domain-containing protein n=1 Tax=Hibiscus trionum TaxID=183268 RepID=A0A9W7I705_HIBTR|nr:hypothetical protein HRI_002640400 [Hibiscus trionum]
MTIVKSFPAQPKALSKEQLRQHFLACDADHNELLTRAELKQAFRKLGAMIPGFRTWEALRCADANNDGCVSREELEALIDFAYKRQYTSMSDK